MTQERPILFSASMVRAILEGRKTQTRRVIKPQPAEPPASWYPDAYNHSEMWTFWGPRGTPEQGRCTLPLFKCPYGKPGDRIWVRENFSILSADAGWQVSTESGLDFEEGAARVRYHADNAVRDILGLGIRDDDVDEGQQAVRLSKKKSVPSIHMPRWASRITLEITAVRVERLQDISEIDACAEGVNETRIRKGNSIDWQSAFSHFADLWRSINGQDSWDANPWVWVIEFKRI